MCAMFGDIKVKSRPLRLAFIIPPDKVALQAAIEINSTLWGGSYNPIIPLYPRALKEWQLYPGQKISVNERILGYVRAFDPDILVNCTGGELPAYLRDLGRRVIGTDDIWGASLARVRDGTPAYGVGIFEILSAVYHDYFEFKRRFPVKVVFPAIGKDHALFWAAAVGQLPSLIQTPVETEFAKAIDIEKPIAEAKNYPLIIAEDSLFLRRLSQYRLETEHVGYVHNNVYAFHMDAEEFVDIVDYWNLRALGRAILPIPKQFVDVPEFIELIRDFIRAEFRVNRHNPSITYGTHIVRSFSSQMSELEKLATILEPAKLIPDNPDARPLSIQHWYPRIWDEWAMGKDGAIPDNVFSQVEEVSFPDAGDTVALKILKPDFVADTAGESPRYANEIYPKFYGQGDPVLADVLPYDHGQNVLRVAGGSGVLADEFRIGRTGLIHLVEWDHQAHWKIPIAEDVFFAWLKDKGFEPKLSSCGRLAKQMYSQLDGWTTVLMHEPLLRLFERMNAAGGKGAPLGEVKNTVKRISAIGDLYQSLVKRGVFQLGYQTQCTHCQRSSWHSVTDLATQLTCPLCHQTLDTIAAVDSANRGAWHLKTAGPFSVGNYADGGYSVLLTMNFFERDRSLQTTPIMSFEAKHLKSGKALEADFAVLWQETVFGETQDGILFAECKSYNKFVRKDFDRMKALAKEFPGAILAFCTLRKNLSAGEVRQIRAIARAGMKQWKTERPVNPVLVLTGNELFNFVGPPSCWREMSVPDWVKRTHTLLEHCNATQSIYLGLPHWHESWRAALEKRRKRQRKLT